MIEWMRKRMVEAERERERVWEEKKRLKIANISQLDINISPVTLGKKIRIKIDLKNVKVEFLIFFEFQNSFFFFSTLKSFFQTNGL